MNDLSTEMKNFLLFITVTTTTMPAVAMAESRQPAKQLALHFTNFCLGHLTQTEMSRRAYRIGAVPERVISLDNNLTMSWRGPKPPNDFFYSFDVSPLPGQRIRIVGCSVGGLVSRAEDVITALAQPSRLVNLMTTQPVQS